MSFDDLDPIEQDMGIRVEQMDPMQLLVYFKTYQGAFGLNLVVQDPQDRKIFQALQKLYGRPTAGRIVKWVTYTHKGRWEGKPVRFSSFCKGRKWWVDMMHLELQDHVKKTDSSPKVSAIPGARVVEF